MDKEFDGILRDVRENRMLIVRYGKSLPLNKDPITNTDPKNVFNVDPIRILFYMKEHLRTIDLFLKVNRFGDNMLSRDEMKYAFEVRNLNLHPSTLFIHITVSISNCNYFFLTSH